MMRHSVWMDPVSLRSPMYSRKILRTFFGDRLTQITIGTYVGIFVYSILVLRAVGGDGTSGFVPRISVTVASLLGIGAVCLLIAFLHHVSTMVQVSGVTAKLARSTLRKIEDLNRRVENVRGELQDHDSVLASWKSAPEPPGVVVAPRPGYLQRVSLDDLLKTLDGQAERAVVAVTPGDFVSVESPLVLIWPAAAADSCRASVLSTVSVASERDIDQDLDFGLRQLTDIALKAMSPGINDPMTAVTCIGYLRAILVRLAESPELPTLLDGEHGLSVLARRRGYDEYLDSLLQINRYVKGDAWVAGELIAALTACARQLHSSTVPKDAVRTVRLAQLQTAALTVAGQTNAELVTDYDRTRIAKLLLDFDVACS